MKKVENRVNFAASRIINCRTHHNSLCRGKNKHYVTGSVMVYKVMSHVMLPRMRKLSPVPTLVAKNKWRLLFEYSPLTFLGIYNEILLRVRNNGV
jgi:hypothetical protein